MSKTNSERARKLREEWLDDAVRGASLSDRITAALDKAEARGRRNACPCCKPATQYTLEDAVHLANELVHTVFSVAGYNSDENNRELVEANKAVVDAIVSRDDAE